MLAGPSDDECEILAPCAVFVMPKTRFHFDKLKRPLEPCEFSESITGY